MKRMLITSLVISLMLSVLPYWTQASSPKITVLESMLEMDAGEEAQIEYNVSDDAEVFFESMNEDVAEVDEHGVVYAVEEGSTRIKLSTEDFGSVAYVRVYVEGEDEEYEVEDLAIIKDGKIVNRTLSMTERDKITLNVKLYPKGVKGTIKWKSDDETVVIVDEKGVVTAVGEGVCKVYAENKADSRVKDYVSIKVERYIKYPEGIKITPDKKEFYVGDTVIFTSELYPSDVTEKHVYWTLENIDCATISPGGVLKIHDKGKITLRAYTANMDKYCEYVIESKYREGYFTLLGSVENVLSDRKMVLTFDAELNVNSVLHGIKAYESSDCNGEEIKIMIEVNKNTVTITPVDNWSIGDNYILIKESVADTFGVRLNKNLLYKINVRG